MVSMSVAITLTILFIALLCINALVIAVWLQKKIKTRTKNNSIVSEFQIAGNPCYEVTEMKQMAETETRVYEMVQEKRDK